MVTVKHSMLVYLIDGFLNAINILTILWHRRKKRLKQGSVSLGIFTF